MHRCKRSTDRGSAGAGRADARRFRDQEGSASVEFIFAGLVLLVPIVYLVVALGVIQAHTLGVQAASRHIARAVATAPDAETADRRASVIALSIAGEYGVSAQSLEVDIDCAAPAPCPSAGELFVVRVESEAELPLVPPVLGLNELARIPIQAESVQRMSGLWAGS